MRKECTRTFRRVWHGLRCFDGAPCRRLEDRLAATAQWTCTACRIGSCRLLKGTTALRRYSLDDTLVSPLTDEVLDNVHWKTVGHKALEPYISKRPRCVTYCEGEDKALSPSRLLCQFCTDMPKYSVRRCSWHMIRKFPLGKTGGTSTSGPSRS